MLVQAETVNAAAPVAATPRNRRRVIWEDGREDEEEEETDVMLMMPFYYFSKPELIVPDLATMRERALLLPGSGAIKVSESVARVKKGRRRCV
jgi:hypothetical protein